jgi:predicted neutral ceramidase superfamily lipid hydrolase
LATSLPFSSIAESLLAIAKRLAITLWLSPRLSCLNKELWLISLVSQSILHPLLIIVVYAFLIWCNFSHFVLSVGCVAPLKCLCHKKNFDIWIEDKKLVNRFFNIQFRFSLFIREICGSKPWKIGF